MQLSYKCINKKEWDLTHTKLKETIKQRNKRYIKTAYNLVPFENEDNYEGKNEYQAAGYNKKNKKNNKSYNKNKSSKGYGYATK